MLFIDGFALVMPGFFICLFGLFCLFVFFGFFVALPSNMQRLVAGPVLCA